MRSTPRAAGGAPAPRIARCPTRRRPSRCTRAARIPARPLRPHLPDRVDDLEAQSDAVVERSAVLVGAVVDQRREEFVNEIAMRRMHLDDVEAGVDGREAAASRKACTTAVMPAGVERSRTRIVVSEGLVTRPDGLPAAFVRWNQAAAVPRPFRAAPCVRRVPAGCRRRSLSLDEIDDLREHDRRARPARCPGPPG